MELSKEKELEKLCPFMSSTEFDEDGDVVVLQAKCVGEKCAIWTEFDSDFGKCGIGMTIESTMILQMEKARKIQEDKKE